MKKIKFKSKILIIYLNSEKKESKQYIMIYTIF